MRVHVSPKHEQDHSETMQGSAIQQPPASSEPGTIGRSGRATNNNCIGEGRAWWACSKASGTSQEARTAASAASHGRRSVAGSARATCLLRGSYSWPATTNPPTRLSIAEISTKLFVQVERDAGLPPPVRDVHWSRVRLLANTGRAGVLDWAAPKMKKTFRTTKNHGDCLGNWYDRLLIEDDPPASMSIR